MSRWFRFYSEALNDPKVQRLDGDTFKAWVNLLCMAAERDGKLPAISDIAFALRIDEHAAATVVERLLNGGLIDKVSGGADGYHYAPHGWVQRQYKSDTSTERVKRFRKRSNNVTETAPDTETDTDTDTDKEKAYAFSGRVARLKKSDFDDWEKRFHAIPDFRAELSTLDAWLTEQPAEKQKKWFSTGSAWLNRRHQEAIERAKPSKTEWAFTGPC